ncbi:MAG TPA: hypothetical protein VE093_18810 [Polyangiaceae bacterium]|jgi:hypothetical protein|nr:hypothetical protein [Polyangiaceae bacterium]
MNNLNSAGLGLVSIAVAALATACAKDGERDPDAQIPELSELFN